MDIGPLIRGLLAVPASESVPEVFPPVEEPLSERVEPRDEPVPAAR